jgi:outer membrane protein TolC
LQRRPDLLAAQAQLDAANARRQQAMAEWFPRLFLGAVFGGEGSIVNGMALGAARFTQCRCAARDADLQRGRTQAINDIAESGQKEAVLHYEDAIVRALEDVENALVALDDERQRAQLLQSAAASGDAALGRAQSLYDRGQIDSPAAARCATRALVRARRRQRRQHASAARQRPTVQGAWRWLGGVRASPTGRRRHSAFPNS